MHKLTLLACLSAASLLAACGPTGGYYDANGRWVPYNSAYEKAHYKPPLPGADHTYLSDRGRDAYVGYDGTTYVEYDNTIAPASRTTVTTYTFDRAGYYDYNGYYIPMDGGLRVPQELFPPRGMCRVWIPNRSVSNQPRVESCTGIQARVPTGGYVIYGG